MQPGLHLKWPWPIETTRIVSTREARSFNIGFVPDPKLEGQRTLLWTKPHYKEEFNLLVASREQGDEAAAANAAEASVPVNLLTVSIPVQFRITNALDWTYRHADPARLLERLGTREVAHYLVSVDMEDIMASGRRRAAEELRERIQQRTSEARLGVEILYHRRRPLSRRKLSAQQDASRLTGRLDLALTGVRSFCKWILSLHSKPEAGTRQ